MWRQVVAQSPGENAPEGEVQRYDLGWQALNNMLKTGRSLSGHERNCAFLNTRGGRFADVSAALGIDYDDDGRVLALTDWDQDGDLDFWIGNRTGPQVRFLRNNGVPGTHSVQFLLRGTTCNRDAIGARIVLKLKGDPGVRARTVRSGGAYLSQSSAWQHFGLGTGTPEIDSIEVRWPDGSSEAIPGVAPDGRYLIVQGSGAASRVGGEPRPVRFEEAEVKAPATGDQARIVLISPVPIPAMKFRDAAGVEQTITGTGAKARLVTLWASWCAPCLAELREWSAQADALRAAGVEVLAINVEEEALQSAAGQVYEKLGAPFALGFGGEGIATQVDVLQRAIISKQRALPLPSSLLIDGEGNLLVIYKGPVSVPQLVADARLAGASDEQIVAAAAPFPGRWLGQPAGASPNQVAIRFIEGGFLGEAEDYLVQLTTQGTRNPMFDKAGALLLLGAIRLDADRLEESAQALREAVSLDPTNRQTHIELAGVLGKLDQPREAVPHYLKALEKRPDDPELHYKLGMTYLQYGAIDEAVASLTRSLALRPSLLAHFNLGNALLNRGDVPGALPHFEAALALDSKFQPAANNLSWLRAAHPDETFRDAPRALELAEALCADPKDKTASHLDTLAVALAAVGRFEDAARTAREAIGLSKAAGDLATAKDIQARLTLFEQNKPYRDP